MPFNTRNPIPSGDLRDLDDNARNIDTWANDKTKVIHPDRFGVERYTWHGIEQKAQLDIEDAARDAANQAASEATVQANDARDAAFLARDQAIAAKLAAENAAAASGVTKYADNKAILSAGVGTFYVNGDVVLVFTDESQSGASAIYKIEANAAVFKTLFDQTRADLLSFTGDISAAADWPEIPAHTDPALDVQAQALANRVEWLLVNKTQAVDSISQLREIPSPKSKTIVSVAGYYAGSNRGGGLFKFDPAVSSGTEDFGLTIIGNDGAVWRRVFDGNVNVSWFGSKGVFSTEDESVYFSRAAKAAPAINNISGALGVQTFPRAPRCEIDVDDGTYVIQTLVDVANKDVTWNFSHAARIAGNQPQLLNGAIARGNERLTRKAYGTLDYATTFSIAADGPDADKSPGITGIGSPSGLSRVESIDSCALFIGNYSPAALHIAESVSGYTSSTVTLVDPLPADKIKKLRRGMILETLHDRYNKWQGVLDSWSADGRTLTVSPGWYYFDNSGAVSTPTGTTGVVVSGMSRVWGQNTALALEADGYAYQAIGNEYSVYNRKEACGDNFDDDRSTRVWGNLMATGGGDTLHSQCGYIVKGNWRHAYVANRHQDYGFTAWYNQKIGFYYRGTGEAIRIENQTAQTFYSVNSVGNVTAGSPTTAASKVIAFRTSGASSSYDVRLTASGGSSTSAQGSLFIEAADTSFSGVVRPSGNGGRSLGTASNRWSEVFASTGTINTSDGRKKTQPSDIPSEVLDAWGEVSLIVYQWLDAVAAKGEDAARKHIGVIAQSIHEAFENKCLNAFDYGLLCYDEWDDKYEPIYETRDVFDWVTYDVKDEENNTIKVKKWEKVGVEEVDSGEKRLVLAAGSSWGIRADQCLFLEAAYQRRRADRIEARLAAIEATLSLNSAA